MWKSIISILILLSTPAYAGDYMKSGQVLQEDSYVFNLEEATNLMNKMSALEQEVENQKKILEQYKFLDQIQQQEEVTFNDLLEIKESQIVEYKELHYLDVDRIKQLNKQVNSSKVEKWIFMGIGVGVTIGSILIADKIDDQIESINNPQEGITLLRF